MYSVLLTQAVVAFNPFSALWEGIKQVLGFIMNLIYMFFAMFGVENMALTIITFTIIIYTLLIPLTVKQQRTMKLNAVIQPEIAAIQKKYKNKKDNESMMKQNEEMQAVYKKYGSSPTGGCLTSFIQLPILLALYRVLYNVPKYVDSVNQVFVKLSESIQNTKGFEKLMTEIAPASVKFDLSGLSDSGITSKITEVLYNLQGSKWDDLAAAFPKLEGMIEDTHAHVSQINTFMFGMNIAESPSSVITSGVKAGLWGMVIVAALIPILSGVLSWLSVKVSNTASGMNQNQADGSDTMQSSLKMMNTIMPIFSVFICYSLPIGVGLYWVFSSLHRVVSYYFIGKHMEKVDVMNIVAKNVEKFNEKQQKKGLPTQRVNMKALANANVKNTEYDEQQREAREQKRKEQIERSTEYYNNSSSGAKPGSLKAKANMVAQYNERNVKGTKGSGKNNQKSNAQTDKRADAVEKPTKNGIEADGIKK